MIVGVDVSSRRIDLAWLENGKPQRWHQELAKGHLIDRLRSIRIEWPWPAIPPRTIEGKVWNAPGAEITDIAIEYPYAPQRTAIAALMATTGIITRQAPRWARVAWPSSQELRAAIGARNTKEAAHQAIRELVWDMKDEWLYWDEHELDALVACIGWSRILEHQDDA